MSLRAHGQVKWFNATKGFGFVRRDDGAPDIFLHISAVQRAGLESVREGDRISFEIEADRKDPSRQRAVNIVPAVVQTGGAF